MLSTIKILQAKNASTGTISMSKRLMAIQETFSTNLGSNQGPNHPLSLTRNGDVNKNQKCETNSSSSSLPPPAPPPPPPPSAAPAAPAAPVLASSGNGWKPSPLVSPSASNPSKPNSLILVPNLPNLPNHQNLSQMCNGQVRLVSQARLTASKSAVEVQTEESPPLHVADCPFNTTKAGLQSWQNKPNYFIIFFSETHSRPCQEVLRAWEWEQWRLPGTLRTW